ncbi:MAG TPA: ABC transporter permease [Rugosimonospora sp.]|nr:ABC transporter permease [Rugosimonospora sp.]
MRALAWLASANTVTVTVLSIVIALVVGAILIVIGDQQVRSEWGYFFAVPGTVLGDSLSLVGGAYANLVKGSIIDPATVSGAFSGTNSWSAVFMPISETLTYTAPLIFTGLAVAFAFRGGLFNIGAQGAVIMGCIGGAVVGLALHLPYGIHLIAALLGAALAGAVWAGIAGYLKARTGAHEVIVTIMLNYVALELLYWVIRQQGIHDPSRPDPISKPIRTTAQLPLLGGANLRWNLAIVLGVLATAGVYWLLQRSTIGFELRAVGSNPDAARTAGMSVARTYILAMVVSGALAGLGGGVWIQGTAYSLTPSVSGTIGFDGITVALLGRGKPWGVAASALLFGALHAGGNRMQSYSHVAIDLVTVVQAVIVILIAAPGLVREIFRLRAARGGTGAGTLAKGW